MNLSVEHIKPLTHPYFTVNFIFRGKMEQEPKVIDKPENIQKKTPLISNKFFIGLVMFVLGAGLAVSVTTVASINDQSGNNFRTKSLAVSNVSQSVSLPSLPNGCNYKNIGDSYSVECSNVIQANSMPEDLNVTIPPMPTIAVPLPNLPQGCRYQTETGGGISVNCPQPSGFTHPTFPPIPTVMVPLPSLPDGCRRETTPEGGIKVSCTNNININKNISIEQRTTPSGTEVIMPSLPEGCTYENNSRGSVSVKCETHINRQSGITVETTPVTRPSFPATSPAATVGSDHQTTNYHKSNESSGLLGKILSPFTNLFNFFFGKK